MHFAIPCVASVYHGSFVTSSGILGNKEFTSDVGDCPI